MIAKARRVLISTLWADGGVAALTQKLVELLTGHGFEVALAYYMPYRLAPDLSVPAWRLLSGAPKRRKTCRFDVPAYEIGVWLPELEWARYLPSRQWCEVLDQYDLHIAACGSVLAALPALLHGKRCLAWVATPYFDDRKDRRKTFSWPRRLLDAVADTPVCSALERWALARAEILSLSHYTETSLRKLAPDMSSTLMPMSIDVKRFCPRSTWQSSRRIGFAGRYDDPRKNIKLLLDAVAHCRNNGILLTLHLIGGRPVPRLTGYAEQLGISNLVEFSGSVAPEELPNFYRSLDVFVIPSLQEGLGIVGLEAMACGCPVVATRCGGPEDYVVDGNNGALVSFDAVEMAAAITAVVGSPEQRAALAEAAVTTVRTRYANDIVSRTFWQVFEKAFAIPPTFPAHDRNVSY